MAVLNVTPDSFSDGGNVFNGGRVDVDSALAAARSMRDAGATIIDVGGESTRPGAEAVSESEELDRVLPVLERLKKELPVALSVDTSSPAVMRESIALGVDMINDVRALQVSGAIEACQNEDAAVCLMHMQGAPSTMQVNPNYAAVIQDVVEFLENRIAALEAAGISRSRIIVDPGFGFGKTLQHNLELMFKLERIVDMGLPVLVGTSRKSMIGDILNKTIDQRLYGGLALTALAVQKGARIIRTHDVSATRDVVDVVAAVQRVGAS